jgi:endonuclease/exonuclease/phosphatase family metal-dependent hydrolase
MHWNRSTFAYSRVWAAIGYLLAAVTVTPSQVAAEEAQAGSQPQARPPARAGSAEIGAKTIRVMSFNIWVGGEASKQPLERTAAVIRAARADLVGLQEARGESVAGKRPDNGRKLADMLGWHYFDQDEDCAVLSRFEIVEPTPSKYGVKLALAPGRFAYFFNTHLSHAPYQPYQLLGIPYGDGAFIRTEAEAVSAALAARGKQVQSLVEEMQPALRSGLPVFLTGDFNEPSHLDWTEATASAKLCPLAVAWPSTRAVMAAGLTDAFRALWPDPVRRPACTWTPTTKPTDPKDHHDRIDFVFFAGNDVRVLAANVVGEDLANADVAVQPYPSDHRAVTALFELGPGAPSPRGIVVPWMDLASDPVHRVVVDKEKGQYLGHPTTVLLEDGRTILAVYPKGHGKGAIVLKRSLDGGRTWSERLPTPASWATSQETPTIHRLVDPSGKKRLVLFSGLYPIRSAVSEDDGATWSELEPIGGFGGIVAMASVVELRTGQGHSMALFHDDGRYLRATAPRPAGSAPAFCVYKSLSTDGGLHWSEPAVVTKSDSVHLCEPGALRSPGGGEIALLLRENSRTRNSFVVISRDEGVTWSEPRELPGALTGDRHVARYAPDGRLFVTFRDMAHESPTRGDWVGWVGRYEDILEGGEGQLRVRLQKNHKGMDCGYAGLELLPDGTFVATSYGHWTAGEPPYVICVRFRLEELDALQHATK